MTYVGHQDELPGAVGPVEQVYVRLEIFLSAVILVWLLAGTYTPEILFRSIAGTLPALAAFTVLAALLTLRNGMRLPVNGIYLALYVILGAGFFALLFSYAGDFGHSDYPRSSRFIFRQSYFLIMLPLAIMAGFVFWKHCYVRLFEFAATYFVPLVAALMISDWVTAYLLGDPVFREFNGYSKYADKGIMTLVFCLIYLARVMSRRGFHFWPLILLGIYFFGTKIFTYGSLFQASTGTIVMALLAIVTVFRSRLALSAQLVVLFLLGIAGLVVIGTFEPGLFRSDLNAYWRFKNWQSNFIALYETGFLGIGFGTPYFPVTSADFTHALSVVKRGSEPWAGSGQIYDLIYLRTQHNSFVNMFFRTGLIGGMAFLVFNIGILAAALRAVRVAVSGVRAQVMLGFTLFAVSLIQISLHVGLETPRFLVFYAFATALTLSLSKVSPAPAAMAAGSR